MSPSFQMLIRYSFQVCQWLLPLLQSLIFFFTPIVFNIPVGPTCTCTCTCTSTQGAVNMMIEDADTQHLCLRFCVKRTRGACWVCRGIRSEWMCADWNSCQFRFRNGIGWEVLVVIRSTSSPPFFTTTFGSTFFGLKCF